MSFFFWEHKIFNFPWEVQKAVEKENLRIIGNDFQVLISFGCVFVGNVSALIDLLSFTLWIFYALNFLGVVILKYSKEYKDVHRTVNVSFRLFYYHQIYKINFSNQYDFAQIPVILPIFTFIFSVFLVLVPLITNPQIGYFFVLLFILFGYVLYVPFVHFKLKFPGIGS